MTMGFRCAKDSNSFLRGIAGTAAVGHDDGGTAIDAEADIMAMKRGADHWGREHVGDAQRLARPGLGIAFTQRRALTATSLTVRASCHKRSVPPAYCDIGLRTEGLCSLTGPLSVTSLHQVCGFCGCAGAMQGQQRHSQMARGDASME